MFKRLRDLPLLVKLLGLGLGGLGLVLVSLLGVMLWQLNDLNQLAQTTVHHLIDDELMQITDGVLHLVEAQDTTLRAAVRANLNLAGLLLEQSGGVRADQTTVAWQAVDQVSQAAETVTLPRLLAGGEWLGQNRDPQQPTLVVDEIVRHAGGVATILQRMNARGDMLRVATTVQTSDGQRAIGTFIPARYPDGTPNPVIETVLRGETYIGLAYVVNHWMMAGYLPLRDSQGAVIGMLFAGLEFGDLRTALMDMRMGASGYVFVLGGHGRQRGEYILSYQGQRDGENIWETRDVDGRPVIQEIINTALQLPAGQTAVVEYRWQNPGEPAPRAKIVQVAYYAPLDWVVGISAYADEFGAYETELRAAQSRLTLSFLAIGLAIGLVTVVIFWFFARSLTRPLSRMVTAAEALAQGDLSIAVEEAGADEIGRLAAAFQRMGGYFRDMAAVSQRIAGGDLSVAVAPRSAADQLGRAFADMVGNLRGLVRGVATSARSVNDSAEELAATAEQAGHATDQIATTMQQVASGTQQQASGVSRTAGTLTAMRRNIDSVARGAHDQAGAVSQLAGVINQAAGAAEQIQRGTTVQAEGVQQAAAAQGEFAVALRQVEGLTAQVVAGSRQSAETAQAGAQMAAQNVDGIRRVRTATGTLSSRVRELGTRSAQIGSIVASIDEIANQTNLLALTPPSKPPGPASTAAASRWWRRKCANWPSGRPWPPRRSPA
ncbi:MAG: Cache 3/Cache 2 fusion domain-containing protein [Anaerolineales bacterium]|nr:Cache 3/Cache 2 fusion domain-containing protein [Anaerolineales bacterium]